MSADTLALKDTTIGRKAIMAVTGLIMVGFVVGHMVGNLTVYQGEAAFNAYAAFLHSMPGLLWVARLTLIAAVVLHVWAAISLVNLNKKARPVRYQVKQNLVTSYAARVMPIGGIVLALFIVYHLLHLTFGVVAPGEFKGWEGAYHNFVTGFQNPIISGIYVLAQFALGLHLFHGVWSMMQSMGLNHRRYNAWRKRIALGVAVAVAGFNISFPVAVLAGIIK